MFEKYKFLEALGLCCNNVAAMTKKPPKVGSSSNPVGVFLSKLTVLGQNPLETVMRVTTSLLSINSSSTSAAPFSSPFEIIRANAA